MDTGEMIAAADRELVDCAHRYVEWMIPMLGSHVSAVGPVRAAVPTCRAIFPITVPVLRGREAEAIALIESVRKEGSQRPWPGSGSPVRRLYVRDPVQQPRPVSGALTAALQASTDDPVELLWSPWATAELLEGASRTGNTELARCALERILAATEPSGRESALGIAARCRALVADGAEAEAQYRAAIDHLSRSLLRPDLARAHLLYGEWLRRQGRRVDARQQLRTAHEMLLAMGDGGVRRACT